MQYSKREKISTFLQCYQNPGEISLSFADISEAIQASQIRF